MLQMRTNLLISLSGTQHQRRVVALQVIKGLSRGSLCVYFSIQQQLCALLISIIARHTPWSSSARGCKIGISAKPQELLYDCRVVLLQRRKKSDASISSISALTSSSALSILQGGRRLSRLWQERHEALANKRWAWCADRSLLCLLCISAMEICRQCKALHLLQGLYKSCVTICISGVHICPMLTKQFQDLQATAGHGHLATAMSKAAVTSVFICRHAAGTCTRLASSNHSHVLFMGGSAEQERSLGDSAINHSLPSQRKSM